jgi:hypothetical protein
MENWFAFLITRAIEAEMASPTVLGRGPKKEFSHADRMQLVGKRILEELDGTAVPTPCRGIPSGEDGFQTDSFSLNRGYAVKLSIIG